MSAFKSDSDNPLVALMLGLTFCHMACQKFSAKKHSLVVQACSFLNTYRSLRGDCQEVHYNLGRSMPACLLLVGRLIPDIDTLARLILDSVAGWSCLCPVCAIDPRSGNGLEDGGGGNFSHPRVETSHGAAPSLHCINLAEVSPFKWWEKRGLAPMHSRLWSAVVDMHQCILLTTSCGSNGSLSSCLILIW